jgi:hypothetical protein
MNQSRPRVWHRGSERSWWMSWSPTQPKSAEPLLCAHLIAFPKIHAHRQPIAPSIHPSGPDTMHGTTLVRTPMTAVHTTRLTS